MNMRPIGDLNPECAVWYWRHYSLFVELCENEDEAISYAISMSDFETGAVEGLQRSDGSFTKREEWVELKAEEDRRYHAWREKEERRQALQPQPYVPPKVEVAAPFDTKTRAQVASMDMRPWLGRQRGSSA